MSRSSLELSGSVQDYLVSHSVRECKVKRELRNRTSELTEKNMQISAEQGQFMAVLALLISAKKVLEVGTFTGYSSLCVAEVLPADGQLIACDVSEEWTNIAKEYWNVAKVADKIDLQIGKATETLQRNVSGEMRQNYQFS